MPRRRLEEGSPIGEEHGIAEYNQGVRALLCRCGQNIRKPLRGACFEGQDLHTDRFGPRLRLTTYHGRRRVRWIDEERNPSRCREGLDENLEPFAAQLSVHDREPGDVRTRPGEGGDEASAHRVGAHCDDGDRPGCLHGGPGRGGVTGVDDINRNSRQFRGEARELLVVSPDAALEPDGLALYPAELAETFLGRARGLWPAHHDADGPHRSCWLRFGGKRRKNEAENDREPDKPHAAGESSRTPSRAPAQPARATRY